MQITSINQTPNFKGYLDKSVKNNITLVARKEMRMVVNEANKRGQKVNTVLLEKIFTKATSIIESLSTTLDKFHSETTLKILDKNNPKDAKLVFYNPVTQRPIALISNYLKNKNVGDFDSGNVIVRNSKPHNGIYSLEYWDKIKEDLKTINPRRLDEAILYNKILDIRELAQKKDSLLNKLRMRINIKQTSNFSYEIDAYFGKEYLLKQEVQEIKEKKNIAQQSAKIAQQKITELKDENEKIAQDYLSQI